MRTLKILLAGAIGWWLGVEAVRAFFAIIVWNVAEDQPSTQLGMVGAAIWLVGLAGWIPARLVGRSNAAFVFAAAAAILSIARAAVVDETWTAVLTIGAVIAWLWWLPAFLDLTGRLGAARLIVPALLLGTAAQVAGQVALDGLDLHALPGIPTALALLGLGAAFAWVVRATGGVLAGPSGGGVSRWGPLALLPWLFLQLSLLANIGRLESLGGWDVPVAGLVAGAGLLLAALVAGWGRALARPVRLLILVATGGLVILAAGGGMVTLLLIPAQAGLALLLAGAIEGDAATPGEGSTPARSHAHLAGGLGGLLFFVFLFALYSDALDGLGARIWPAAVVLVALPRLFGRPRPAASPARLDLRAPIALVLALVVGTALGAPPGGTGSPVAAAAPVQLAIFDYNIHQGFGRNGVPGLRATVATIRAANAELVTLQEVNRVWDLSGGVDSFSWLAGQLPEYHAIYGPTSKVRFGNAIFSRHPVLSSGFEWFPFGPSKDQRGFVWAVVDTQAGPLLVITMHMTPYNRGEEAQERDQQAQILLDFWSARGKPMAVFAGDYNAEPDDAAIQRTAAGGLIDALAKAGNGTQATFRSTGTMFGPGGSEKIDYVFVSPGIAVKSAVVIDSAASDHYPVQASLLLGPAR